MQHAAAAVPSTETPFDTKLNRYGCKSQGRPSLHSNRQPCENRTTAVYKSVAVWYGCLEVRVGRLDVELHQYAAVSVDQLPGRLDAR